MGHKLGQVFLHDHNIIRKIVQASQVTQEECAVEIGCGAGILTQALSESAKQVIVIEVDQECIDNTKQNINDPDAIAFVHQDVLTTRLQDILQQYSSQLNCKVIANIPYYISAKIIKWLIQDQAVVERATLMVQDEFAQKLTASPNQKTYTSLTLFTNFHYDITYNFKVSKNCFYPKPKVDSAVISLTPKTTKPKLNEDQFFSMIRACFASRRKTIVSSLNKNPYIQLSPEQKARLKESQYAKKRAEDLDQDAFLDLYQILFI